MKTINIIDLAWGGAETAMRLRPEGDTTLKGFEISRFMNSALWKEKGIIQITLWEDTRKFIDSNIVSERKVIGDYIQKTHFTNQIQVALELCKFHMKVDGFELNKQADMKLNKLLDFINSNEFTKILEKDFVF